MSDLDRLGRPEGKEKKFVYRIWEILYNGLEIRDVFLPIGLANYDLIA